MLYMSKYTIFPVSESGSFGHGDTRDVEYVNGKHSVVFALEDWIRRHNRMGGDPAQASLLVFKGIVDADAVVEGAAYPDFVVTQGPRGGVVWGIA
jgi:hypothetical protein